MDSIIGERISGPANIRDTINGKILFTLNDSTLVTCTRQKDGWYEVGLQMEIPNSEYGEDTLRKGRKIVVGGKVVGEVLSDMYVSTSTTGKESWAELTGYTYKDNIYPRTIIEKVLVDYTAAARDRSLETFQPFIRSFALEEDRRLDSFVTFFNYENWIDDPSPLMRIQLVFRDNKLIGVVHSRPLKLPGTKHYTLDRGFRVAFFRDTPRSSRESFIKLLNRFLNSVD